MFKGRVKDSEASDLASGAILLLRRVWAMSSVEVRTISAFRLAWCRLPSTLDRSVGYPKQTFPLHKCSRLSCHHVVVCSQHTLSQALLHPIMISFNHLPWFRIVRSKPTSLGTTSVQIRNFPISNLIFTTDSPSEMNRPRWSMQSRVKIFFSTNTWFYTWPF